MQEAGCCLNAEAMLLCLLTCVKDEVTQLTAVGATAVDDVRIVLIAKQKGDDLVNQ